MTLHSKLFDALRNKYVTAVVEMTAMALEVVVIDWMINMHELRKHSLFVSGGPTQKSPKECMKDLFNRLYRPVYDYFHKYGVKTVMAYVDKGVPRRKAAVAGKQRLEAHKKANSKAVKKGQQPVIPYPFTCQMDPQTGEIYETTPSGDRKLHAFSLDRLMCKVDPAGLKRHQLWRSMWDFFAVHFVPHVTVPARDQRFVLNWRKGQAPLAVSRATSLHDEPVKYDPEYADDWVESDHSMVYGLAQYHRHNPRILGGFGIDTTDGDLIMPSLALVRHWSGLPHDWMTTVSSQGVEHDRASTLLSKVRQVYLLKGPYIIHVNKLLHCMALSGMTIELLMLCSCLSGNDYLVKNQITDRLGVKEGIWNTISTLVGEVRSSRLFTRDTIGPHAINCIELSESIFSGDQLRKGGDQLITLFERLYSGEKSGKPYKMDIRTAFSHILEATSDWNRCVTHPSSSVSATDLTKKKVDEPNTPTSPSTKAVMPTTSIAASPPVIPSDYDDPLLSFS